MRKNIVSGKVNCEPLESRLKENASLKAFTSQKIEEKLHKMNALRWANYSIDFYSDNEDGAIHCDIDIQTDSECNYYGSGTDPEPTSAFNRAMASLEVRLNDQIYKGIA